ncbi:MAG TPA: OmpA family protein [Rhodanobacter sp.]|nr:OmpA family protein [Rhodanobacter sp.]
MSGSLIRSTHLSIDAIAKAMAMATGDGSNSVELPPDDLRFKQVIDALAREMHQKFARYVVTITPEGCRIRVDAVAHFAFNSAMLRDEDKPLLDDFAEVVSSHCTQALITVECFADAADHSAYSLRLGQERTQSVREYLVNMAGLLGDKVRTACDGKVLDRRVDPDGWGDESASNRHVALVIEFVGTYQPGGFHEDIEANQAHKR